MNDTTTLHCLNCRYPRTGLLAATPCPECGEPGITDLVMIARGWQDPNSWFVRAVLAGLAALVALAGWAIGGKLGLACGGIPTVLAILLALWAREKRRAERAGGDTLWLVRAGGVTIVRQASVSHLANAEIASVAVDHSVLGWYVRIKLSARFPKLQAPSLWMRRKDPVSVRLIARLRRRVQGSKHARGI